MRLTVPLLAAVILPACLVTDTHATPNQNDPPRILPYGVGSTTRADSVFVVTPTSTTMPNVRSVVTISADIFDSDNDTLAYSLFVTGPAPDTGFDAGVALPDAGTSVPAGFYRRQALGSDGERDKIVIDRDTHVGGRTFPSIDAAQYFETTGRCYAVELRVSTEFQTDRYEPIEDGDVDSITFWVASVDDTNSTVDLRSCPRQSNP